MSNIQEIITSVLEAEQASMLPDPDELSYYILEKERKIYLDFDIDDNVLTIQRMIMRWNMEDKGKKEEDRKPIWIYIMSYGGHLDYMWSLIDAIEASATPVYTVNIGVCCSAAALLFIAGKRRYMTKNGKVVIHEGSASVAGDAVKVLDASDSYKKELKKMKDYIADNTKIPRATINKKKNNDWELDADYCLENGVCTCIVSNLEEVI